MKTIQEITNQIIDYGKARGWRNKPADCAKSICIEAAELLEHFQWDDQIEGKDKTELEFEAADILWYLLTFCYYADIDMEDAFQKKYLHNEKKYPAEMFNGKHNSKFYKSQKKKYRAEK